MKRTDSKTISVSVPPEILIELDSFGPHGATRSAKILAIVANAFGFHDFRPRNRGERQVSKYYFCAGNVRGNCGHKHKTLKGAWRCWLADCKSCKKSGGYSDRNVKASNNGIARSLNDHEFDEWIDLNI